MHSPTVMVKLGLMEEARTISALSPVARMLRPRRVPRNSTSSTPAATVMAADRRMSPHAPPTPVCSNREKMVSCFSRDWLAFQPIAIRLTVYNPVLVTMPARMAGTPSLVWRKAVINPAQAPASMAAGMARKGWPAAVTDTDTAQPRMKQPSVVRSAMSSTRKLRNRAIATRAYWKPSSRAVWVTKSISGTRSFRTKIK